MGLTLQGPGSGYCHATEIGGDGQSRPLAKGVGRAGLNSQDRPNGTGGSGISRRHDAIAAPLRDRVARDGLPDSRSRRPDGTHLNGRRVGTSSPLKNGDEIQAGQTTFRVRIEATDTNGAITTSTSLGAAALAASPSTGHGQTPELVEPAAQAPGQAPAEPPGVEVDRQLLDTVPASSSRIAAKPARIPVADPRPASVPGPACLCQTGSSLRTMLWEDLKGTPKLTVIINCTCDMTGRGSPAPVAAKQLPIFKSDVPGGDEAADSIDSSRTWFRTNPKRTWSLSGKGSFSSGESSELPLDFSLRVGTLDKTIRAVR